MPSLILDRRLQTCTQEELRALASKLLAAWAHHGRPDWEDMPKRYKREFDALRVELERRGVQLTIF
jgi:hypothetical protein